MVGFPGEMRALLENFRQSPYHTPFDDAKQPVNLETIAKFEEVAMALLLDVPTVRGVLSGSPVASTSATYASGRPSHF